MKTHKTFFGRIFGSAWDSIKAFFDKIFEEANHELLEAAIITTQALKAALQSGVVTAFVKMTPTKVDDTLLEIANKNLPKILASEILLKSLNPSNTEADNQAIIKQIVDQFGGLSDAGKEELFTSIAAKIYVLFQQIKSGKKVTFGKASVLVETAWEEYASNQAA